MEERYAGRSGLRVSRLGLGTLTWGAQTSQAEAAVLLRDFVEAGGTLVDTAVGYAGGRAEEVLGALLGDVVAREDLVLVTKAGAGAGTTPGDAPELPDAPHPPADAVDDHRPDTSARTMLASLDRSLRRLGTDHVDLWLAHAWDGRVPVEETVRALQSAVSTGRARYAGVADHTGWQLATTAAAAAACGAPLVAAATELSLLQRAAEAEVLPAADHHGLGVLAWAPLARGVLTGKYRAASPPIGSRARDEQLAAWIQPYLHPRAQRVVEAVATAADGLDVDPLEVALAWVLGSTGVASAVVGVRDAEQLADAVLAEQLELPEEIRAALDDVSAG